MAKFSGGNNHNGKTEDWKFGAPWRGLCHLWVFWGRSGSCLTQSFLGPIYLGSNLRRADLGKLQAANRGGSSGGDKVQIPSKKSNLWQMYAHTPLPFPAVAGGFAIGRSPSSLPCCSLCALERGGKRNPGRTLQERSGRPAPPLGRRGGEAEAGTASSAYLEHGRGCGEEGTAGWGEG